MFEKIINFFKGLAKKEKQEANTSKDTAKERLHLVLMQDRANVSADFLELMKQEIIEVIKKYIEIDEGSIDVRLTNKANDDGTTGAPALYANIPIMNIKHEMGKEQSEKENENEKENDNNKPEVKEKQEEKQEPKKPEETKNEKQEEKIKEKSEESNTKENEEKEVKEEKPKEQEENKQEEEKQNEEMPVTNK